MNTNNLSFNILLSFIVIFIGFFLVNTIKEQLLPYDPKVDELKRRLSLIDEKAHKIHFYTDKKSYTINKKKMHLCVKDENDNYYDDNMLIYVSLHELAHVLCDEIGHTPKFWAIFDQLLEKASKIIDPVTNKPVYDPDGIINKDYCNSNYHNS